MAETPRDRVYKDAEELRLAVLAMKMQFTAISEALIQLGVIWTKFVEENGDLMDKLAAEFAKEEVTENVEEKGPSEPS